MHRCAHIHAQTRTHAEIRAHIHTQIHHRSERESVYDWCESVDGGGVSTALRGVGKVKKATILMWVRDKGTTAATHYIGLAMSLPEPGHGFSVEADFIEKNGRQTWITKLCCCRQIMANVKITQAKRISRTLSEVYKYIFERVYIWIYVYLCLSFCLFIFISPAVCACLCACV